MTLRYLLDTNVLSESSRWIPNPNVLAHMEAHSSEIATAAPVWNELLYGYYRMPNSECRRKIERHLFSVVAETMTILPYNREAAEWHAAERARLSRVGRTPPFVDGQIAAVAYTNDLVLVTANVADYADFLGLIVEDWRL